MKKSFLLFFSLVFSNFLVGQNYSDYLGAGHDKGISVTTSSNQNTLNSGNKSVDGFPVTQKEALIDASRFLAQATLGYDYEMIETTAAMGFEAWIDEQLSLPANSSVELTNKIASLAGDEPENLWGMFQFRSAWWNLVLKESDILRQRVTYSLSQILVLSSFGNDFFEDQALLSSSYYDILNKNAFGNYRDLLSEVSTSISMGFYLNHLNNPKSDPANNIHPDENYAREIMQLFSIGLYELNNDGTRKMDTNGDYIPTYTNDDIREFAKIFTGFGDGHPLGIWDVFGGEDEEHELESLSYPMKMYEAWHEQGTKTLLNGQIVPAGQTGMEDFNDAIDNLFNHPNVGPFIGKALIQLMVSANPSPAYINRVANTFNDNGAGVRGDMSAVIKAILLDPEARECDPTNDPNIGKLREPIVRYSGFLRAFNAKASGNPNNLFAILLDDWENNTGQIPLYASSVFNFYSPNYQPNGLIAAADLVAPVFQIHNSSTSIGYVNEVYKWLFEGLPFSDSDEEEVLDITSKVTLDFSDEQELLASPTNLIDRLDILLACGQLSDNTKTTIKTAISQLSTPTDQLNMAVYLVLISPEYAVLK